jgi:hypothetical protein
MTPEPNRPPRLAHDAVRRTPALAGSGRNVARGAGRSQHCCGPRAPRGGASICSGEKTARGVPLPLGVPPQEAPTGRGAHDAHSARRARSSGVPPLPSAAARSRRVPENAGPVPAWPADAVERRPLASLTPYARNARTHSEGQVAEIAASIRE